MEGVKVIDRRFIQANKEALMALILSLAYLAWWYVTAYGFGEKSPSEYTYIMGLPTWFFLSCILGFFLFAILTTLMVVLLFKDLPLDGKNPDPAHGEDEK